MGKTFVDYLTEENKKKYQSYINDPKIFEDCNEETRVFCTWEVLQTTSYDTTYEELEEQLSEARVRDYVNYRIAQYNPNKEPRPLEFMNMTAEEFDVALTLMGV